MRALFAPRVAAFAAAIILGESVAHACATAPPADADVATRREEALIVWDEEHHVEHFVRSAVFDTKAKSFGFLVPTPTKPTLAEASDTMPALRDATKAPVEHRSRIWPEPVGCTMLPFVMFARSATKSEPAVPSAQAVRVLEETTVAGLDAVVLEADDKSALREWLTSRGFAFRPALEEWVAPYLAQHWKITAFRYARPDVASNGALAPAPITSRAVRISFATDAPIYPYREPRDVAEDWGRELHLFVVASRRLEAHWTEGTHAWDATLPFAAKADVASALAAALPGTAPLREAWINEYVDRTAKRPPTDLVFRAGTSDAEVRRPPVVLYDTTRILVPYEIPFVALGIAWWWRRKRRRST